MRALLIIDVQNDFLPGGRLAVPDGDAIVPVVNRLADAFDRVILTQDWHTAGHQSFASSHEGHEPYDVIEIHTGGRCCGPTIACRVRRALSFTPSCGRRKRSSSSARDFGRTSTRIPRSMRTTIKRLPGLPATCANGASVRFT